MSDENCAEHCIDERHMICDHSEVLMNFNNCYVCSEVYDTLTANLSAIFQKKKLQLILAESVDFKCKLFIKKHCGENTFTSRTTHLFTSYSFSLLGCHYGVISLFCKLSCVAWKNIDSSIKGSLNLNIGRAEGRAKQVGICFIENQFLKHLERMHNDVCMYLYRKDTRKCLNIC